MPPRTAPLILPFAELRATPGATVDRLLTERRAIYLSRRGRPCAVMLSLDAYDALLAGHGIAVGSQPAEVPSRMPRPLRLTSTVSPEVYADVDLVMSALEAADRPLFTDEVIKATGLDVPRVSHALLALRLSDLVDQSGLLGGYSVRSPSGATRRQHPR